MHCFIIPPYHRLGARFLRSSINLCSCATRQRRLTLLNYIFTLDRYNGPLIDLHRVYLPNKNLLVVTPILGDLFLGRFTTEYGTRHVSQNVHHTYWNY